MSPTISSLPILILYPHNRCNCRCVMCDIWKTTDAREISPADLERHAADIASLAVRWVIFSGGEPLMHSDLFRLCSLLRTLGVRLTILSTGLLLQNHAHKIIEHVDEVIVSLDGPPAVHDQIRRVAGAFEAMSAGIRELHRIHRDFPVAARCTVQKQNCTSLNATVDAAREMELRSISFLAADLTSTAFNRENAWPIYRQAEVGLTVEEAIALEREMETMIESRSADFNSGFILESPDKLRRIISHFRAHLGLEEPRAPRCNAPWVSTVLEADGTVRPCFFHDPIGQLDKGSLREVLNSPKATQFRQLLQVAENPTCRRCVCSLYLNQADS